MLKQNRFLKIEWIVLLFIIALVNSRSFFHKENIFPVQDKHVHSSSIVECPNGDLLVCWFHGSSERTADDVMIQGSRLRQGAAAWQPVFQMADTTGFPDCNPVLFSMKKNNCGCFGSLFWRTTGSRPFSNTTFPWITRSSGHPTGNGTTTCCWSRVNNFPSL